MKQLQTMLYQPRALSSAVTSFFSFLVTLNVMFVIFIIALLLFVTRDTIIRCKGKMAEVGVSQNSLQVSQIAVAQMHICVAHYAFFSALAQFALRSMPFFQCLRSLSCALCLFFQRLRNLRLRIGKSSIRCTLIANFSQDAQSQNNF